MIFIAFYSVIFCIVIALIYLLISKTILLKILSFNYLSNMMIVLITMLSLLNGNDSYVDIALTYALIGPVSTLFIVKYLKKIK